MLRRFDAFRPYALLLTVPVTLLWTRHLGPFVGSLAVVAHAAGVLFLAASWVRRDLARGFNPRLGLTSDRFDIDRETLDLAAPMLGLFTLALALALLVVAPLTGLYALFALAAGLWLAAQGPSRRFVMIEAVAPAALLVGPAMLLRAPAWGDHPAPAISPAAHAAAWLVGAILLAQLLLTMTRDREADRAASIATTVAPLSRPAAVALCTAVYAAVALLAALGAAAHWWGVAPVLLTGWTTTAVVALLCLRWDSWAVGAATLGGAATAITVALTAI